MGNAFNPKELSDFARYYGFHYDGLDPASLVKDICIDMKRGLEGKSSSLPMIPTYISPVSKVPAGKTVLALDAGGTNLRVSLVSFDEEGKALAKETEKHPMPGTKGRAVNSDQFFDAIAEAALKKLSVASDIAGIGFTFSYPMEIQPNADGILTALSKEVEASDVVGKTIGAELREALARRGYVFKGPIVLLNDAVATLLSGLASIPANGGELSTKDDYGFPGGPVIGFILGTGFNTAYPETNIPKINFKSSSPQIVVCESGTFHLRYRGPLDIEFDKTTKTPGTFSMEKATSGAYLGQLSLHILKQAVKDKVITFKKADELLAMTHLESRFLNEFMRSPLLAEGPLGSLFAKDEGGALASVQYLVSIITERGGLFSASVLAAAVEHLQAGCEPYAPVRIAVEGTTYVIYKGMRRSLESWLHNMLIRGNPRPYIIAPVEQASLFGAAVAALSKSSLKTET